MESGEINRKALGSIVFQDKGQLEKLNGLVWPAMALALKDIIRECKKPVVVIEAAVLLTAAWENNCHEVNNCFFLNTKLIILMVIELNS